MDNIKLTAKVLNLENIIQHLIVILLTKGALTQGEYGEMIKSVRMDIAK